MRWQYWCIASALSASAFSAGKTTTVTTYITTVQEERESTRFTLTEWLRIKERMKLMDVWLAMFSQPEKDQFSPELSLYYGVRKGASQISGLPQSTSAAPVALDAVTLMGSEGRLQFWLTNLFSGTLGIRTLNIDFGFEAYLAMPALDFPAITSIDHTTGADVPSPAMNAKSSSRYNSVDFRIFGKNIQDSSLIIKVGEYVNQNVLLPLTNHAKDERFTGLLTGLELELYLFRWLGLEGSYLRYLPSSTNAVTFTGTDVMYGAYIEISLLRFMGGMFQEDLSYDDGVAIFAEKRTGMYFGGKLNF